MVQLSADQRRIKCVREGCFLGEEGLFCFRVSPGEPGLSPLPRWPSIRREGRLWMLLEGRVLLRHKPREVKVLKCLDFLEGAGFFWAQPGGMQTLSGHAKGQPAVRGL